MAYNVVTSASPDRSAPFELDDATFTPGDRLYAFVDEADAAITRVRFFLDEGPADPTDPGPRIQVENSAPWDIQGGSRTAANGLDTSALAPGEYTVTTVIDDVSGGSLTLTDTFTLDGASAPYDTVVSTSPDRSDPFELDEATFTVGDRLYAFVDNADAAIARVRFFLDEGPADPTDPGTRIQVENSAPWDIQGGSRTAANGLDTSGLAPGEYTVTTVIDDTAGGSTTLSDTFVLEPSSPGEPIRLEATEGSLSPGRGDQAWGAGVTISGFDTGGNLSEVVWSDQFDDPGFGVDADPVGSDSWFPDAASSNPDGGDRWLGQIDFYEDLGSETMVIDFNRAVENVTITVGMLGDGEGGPGLDETGIWRALCDHGDSMAVMTGIIDPDLSSSGNLGVYGTYEFEIDVSAPILMLELEATQFESGDGASTDGRLFGRDYGENSSDFNLVAVEFTEALLL